uniref:Uncharacterized protein n=1 Tax=Clastoptera arizonana TaxID=38151 RepID=A0A1B6CJU1_9HEMI
MKLILLITVLCVQYSRINSTVDENNIDASDENKYNVNELEQSILNYYKNPEKSTGQKVVDDLGKYIVGLYRFMRKMKQGDKKITKEGIEYYSKGKPEFMKYPPKDDEFREMMNCSNYESQHYRYLRQDIDLAWDLLKEHIEDLKTITTESVPA